MNKLVIVVLSLLATPAQLSAGTNVWTTHGPSGGIINAVAIDPKSSSTIYVSAGTAGIFKSTDGGASWNAANSGLTGSSYFGLAIDPKNPSTLYAWGGKLFKSTDGAQSWTQLSLPDGVSSLVLDPQNPSTLYVAAGRTGVLKSTDGGVTWDPSNSGLLAGGVASLGINLQDPQTLYALTYSTGPISIGAIYRSTDGGASWISPLKQKLLNLGLPPTNTCDTWNYYFARIVGRDLPPADKLGCYPADNRELEITLDQYLTALQGFANGRSDAVNFGLIPNPRTLVSDPQNSNKVYVLTYRGIFVSTDGALSWNDANSGLQDITGLNFLAANAGNPATLYAGSYSRGRLYKSVDGGLSWDLTPSALPGNTVVNVVAVDPQNPGTIYAGTQSGLFKTTDAASNWNLQDSGLGDANVISLVLDPKTPGTVYAGVGGALATVFKTMDGGTTWTRNDFPSSGSGPFALLAIDPANPAILYAGGICCNPPHPALFKSTDAGVTWSTTGPPQFPGRLIIDPRDSNTLYALSGLVGGGVIKSTDGGISWVAVNSGLGGTPNNVPSVFPLIMDPKDPETLYCIRYSDGQMFKTSNGAFSWSPVNTGWDRGLFHATTVIADPQYSGTLYAGTTEFDCGYGDVCPTDYYDKVNASSGVGIFKSTDSGQSWLRLDTPASNAAYSGFALAIDPKDSNRLYEASGYPTHVFRSTDGGASWSPLDTGLPGTQVTGLVVDGQSPSTLYAATQGSGVLAITFASQ